MAIQPDAVLDPTPTLDAARRAFGAFVDLLSRDARAVALHDSDADGVTAGVVWQYSFKRAGFAQALRVTPDRERNAWTKANKDRVRACAPESLFVLDLGSGPQPIIDNLPTCFIDHHRPEGVPPEATLISAYSWQPIPNTSLLVWKLCATITDTSDLDWIAAIGTLSDLGDNAPFDLLATAKRKYKSKYLKEATVLINAARRSSIYDPEAAARALLQHANPRALVNSDADEVQQLRLAREEVKAAMNEAKKAAPVFAGSVALVRMSSPCQIHPLIAQIWRSRLPRYIVIAANEGYLPNRVNFSARSAANVSVLKFLREIELSEGEGYHGHGHDQASGGSLPIQRWNELLAKLGFGSEVFAVS
ncbi:MAG: DHH family phosphoesterase [Pyrinomonadaceae bacterium]